MATLTIQIRSGTMMNMDTNVAVKLAKAAVDKGYAVRIFGYGEGITMVKTGQDPKRFPNVGNISESLVKEGVVIAVCTTCCAARGVKRGEEIQGTKIGSLTNDFAGYVAETDRLVTLSR